MQSWLDESGAGLYGNAPVFEGRRAAFYVLAAYPGYDPHDTWSKAYPRPNGPCGWQWQGTHTEFGLGVDRGWYDDWFLAGQPQSGDDDMPFDVFEELKKNDDYVLADCLQLDLAILGNPDGFPQRETDEANQIALYRQRGRAGYITYLKNVKIGAPNP